jgi:uncharacterized membrane protein YhiD involved in acid resistance
MLKGDVIDPSRVIGQVITGIGFLGGGYDLHRKPFKCDSYLAIGGLDFIRC